MKALAGRSLLVADSDAAGLGRWRQRLLGEGARVICSSSMDSALANAITFPAGTFHAAVVEHRPGRLDAMELAGALRAVPGSRHLPIVVIADLADRCDQTGGDRAGGEAGDPAARPSIVLRRPVSIEALASTLLDVLACWLPAPASSGVRERAAAHALADGGSAAAAGTSAAPAPAGPIDWSQVESLRCVDPGGNDGIVGKAIRLYVDHAPRLLEEILTYRVTGDLRDVRQAAHSLRSMSASLGAHAVAELGATIETAAAKGDFELIDAVASALEAEYRRAESALRSMMSTGAAITGLAAPARAAPDAAR